MQITHMRAMWPLLRALTSERQVIQETLLSFVVTGWCGYTVAVIWGLQELCCVAGRFRGSRVARPKKTSVAGFGVRSPFLETSLCLCSQDLL